MVSSSVSIAGPIICVVSFTASRCATVAFTKVDSAGSKRGRVFVVSLGFSDEFVAGQGELLAVQYKH